MSEVIAAHKPIPSGTVTFLFTDIEDPTERWERYRDAMQAAVRRHEDILHQAVNAHDGYVFKTIGDALYQARGDDTGCDRALANLAELEFAAGNAARAIERAQEALAIDLRLKRKSN